MSKEDAIDYQPFEQADVPEWVWPQFVSAFAEFAIEEINQAGGVLGKKLELVARDCRNDQGLGVRLAEELIEEDVALFSYVCPGKNDFGPMLRQTLTIIETEG